MTKLLSPLAVFLAATVPFATAQTCPQIINLEIAGQAVSSTPAPGTLDPTLQLAPQPNTELVAFAGQHYFAATSTVRGRELYRTDGATAALVTDLNPGTASSFPRELTVFGGELYFVADTPATGVELFKTDGVTTVLVADLAPGGADANVQGLALANGWLLFVAESASGGPALWRTDGTALGTAEVLAPGVVAPSNGTAFLVDATTRIHTGAGGQYALFFGRDAQGAYDLWRTDGTAGGTFRVGTAADWNGQYFVAWDYYGIANLGGATYFVAPTAAEGRELWKSDGTLAGTHLVADINPGSFDGLVDLNHAAVFGGELYFRAASPAEIGPELYKTDGTASGTQLAADIVPGFQGSAPLGMTVWNGALYFAAGFDGVQFGRELWRLRPNGQLTLVADIWPGPGGSFGLEEAHFLPTASGLYFGASDGPEGAELWRYDGVGVQRVAVTYPGHADGGPAHLTDLGGGELLMSSVGQRIGRELFRAGAGGAQLIANLASESAAPWRDPEILEATLGDAAFIRVSDFQNGEHLVRWHPGLGAEQLDPFENTNANLLDERGFQTMVDGAGGTGRVLIQANDTYADVPFWAASTLGFEPFPQWGGYDELPTFAFYLGQAGERVVFIGFTEADGYEPWSTDGTEQGTVQLGNFSSLSLNSLGGEGVTLGDEAYFAMSTTTTGFELWKSDGTPAGTQIVVDLLPGAGGSSPQQLTRFGDKLYFTAADFTSGRELYVTDGTAAGTFQVKDINPGTADSAPTFLTAYEGKLYFSAQLAARGRELWVTDGTAAGTQMVVDLMPGGASGSPVVLTPTAHGLYFSAEAPNVGKELFRTDGTAAGTTLVADINPGTGGSHPILLTPVGGGLAFGAAGPSGTRLYFSDGTAPGTGPICPTSALINPLDLRVVGGELLFTALDNFERKVYRIADVGATVQDLGFGFDDVELRATPPVLGGQVSVDVQGGTQGEVKLLLVATPSPTPDTLFVEPGQASWLQLGYLQVGGVFVQTPFNKQLAVPSQPSLAGLRVHMQVWTPGPFGVPARTSNGLALRLGS